MMTLTRYSWAESNARCDVLKTGTIFDLETIENFYNSVGEKASPENDTMFFVQYENDEIYGMVKLKMEGENCKMFDLVKVYPNIEYEEFLLKSAINFALTFEAEYIVTTKKYKEFLIPMHFYEENETMKGSLKEIDFPRKCQHK